MLTPTVLHRLAEPLPDGPQATAAESSTAKIPYADLATGPFAVVVGLLAAAAVGLSAGMLAPPLVLPGWLVLGTLGLLLAAIDARTTWLPLSLTRVAWVAMAAALVLGSLLGGWAQGARGVGGFLVAGTLFWLIWRVTGGGFGFGDVRFAPLVGAATASVSWTLLAWGLVLGSLTGAAVGLVRLATRRRGAFAYAPSILAGGYLAMPLAWLDHVEQRPAVRVGGLRLRRGVMSPSRAAERDDVTVGAGVQRQEVSTEPVPQLVLPRQPDHVAGLHRVEGPLDRAVEVEPGVPVADDQLDHHVADREHRVADLRSRDEELVAVARLPLQVRLQLAGQLLGDHWSSLRRASERTEPTASVRADRVRTASTSECSGPSPGPTSLDP